MKFLGQLLPPKGKLKIRVKQLIINLFDCIWKECGTHNFSYSP